MTSSLLGGTFGKGVSETEKRQERGILLLLAPLLFKSIFLKGVTRAGKGVMRAVRGYSNADHMDKYF